MPPRGITPDYVPYTTVRPDQIEGPPTRPIHETFPEVHLTGAVGEAMGAIGRGYQTLSEATKHTAAAFDKLGAQVEHAGSQVWERAVGLKELENETLTKKALIEYDRYMTEKRVDYDSKMGDAASTDTLKAFMDDAESKRQTMRAKLPQSSQKDFDNHSIASMGRDNIHAATHTSAQIKAVAVGASTGRLDTTIDTFGKTGDINDAGSAIETIGKEVYGTLAPAMGWPKEKADEKFREYVGKMIGSKTVAMSDTDPTLALKFLEANKQYMDNDKYEQARRTVWNAQERRDGRNIADKVQERMPDASLEEKRAAAKKDAKEINPLNPDLPAAADDRVRAQHAIQKKEEKEALDDHKYTTLDAAYGYSAPGGKKPTTIEELFVDPKVKAAYDALPPADKHKIDAIIANNSKEDYPESPAARARYHQLLGMSKPDSASTHLQKEFLDIDLENEKIPAKWRDKLFSEQRNLRAKPVAENPLVDHGMKVMKPFLPDNLKKQGPQQTQYMGALWTALQDAQEKKGKIPLTNEETKQIGDMILQDQTEISGWRSYMPSFLGGARPLYEKMEDVPSDFKEGLKKMNPNITDRTIIDLWAKDILNQRMKELQETSKPAAKKPAGPIPPTIPASQ